MEYNKRSSCMFHRPSCWKTEILKTIRSHTFDTLSVTVLNAAGIRQTLMMMMKMMTTTTTTTKSLSLNSATKPQRCSFKFNNLKINLYNKRRYVCLSVCIYVPYGRPNGWADRDQTWHTHSCPSRSVSVKVIHVCVREWQNYETPGTLRESDTWRTLTKLRKDDG